MKDPMSQDVLKPPDGSTVTLLRHASPDWVGRLSRGASWTFSGAILGYGTSRFAELLPSVGSLIELCTDVVFFVGIWMLTSPKPIKSRRILGIRAINRGVSVLVVTFDAMFVAVGYFPTAHLVALRRVGLIFGSVVLLFTAFPLAGLAVRIPELGLAARMQFVITGLAIMSFFLGIGTLYVESDNSIVESIRGNTLLIAAAIPVIFIHFVFAFWCLWLLHRFNMLTTHEAARTEDRGWNALHAIHRIMRLTGVADLLRHAESSVPAAL